MPKFVGIKVGMNQKGIADAKHTQPQVQTQPRVAAIGAGVRYCTMTAGIHLLFRRSGTATTPTGAGHDLDGGP